MVGNRSRVFKSAKPEPASQWGPTAVCLVRQPLFNADEDLVGHRLLSGADGSGSPGGYLATMPQCADTELVLAEELHAIAPRGLVIVSVSLEELLERRALSLPHDRVVLCLPVTEAVNDELLDAIDRHAMRGFRLALDAVELAAVNGPLLERVQTVVVEVEAHSAYRLEQLVASVRQRSSPRKLVAAGVNTRRSFQTCSRLGFDLFQGEFFLRPTAGSMRTAAEAGLGTIGTMAELASTDDFEGLVAIITRDPGLSMRLLRYANSGHMALPRRVGSVHEALAWLGTVAVREFALIAALANVPEAPAEMLVTALTRARMSQQLSRRLASMNPEEAFTVGLFSVAEAVTNAPIEAILGELPLRENVASALLGGVGELGRLLAAVIAYERGDFVLAMALAGASELLAETYLEALRWADSAVDAIG